MSTSSFANDKFEGAMIIDAIRVQLTIEEAREYSAIAISFKVFADGSVQTVEHWPFKDELWADQTRVTIPPRVARIGLQWISERLAERASP